ncbi:MAG: hypothetical protein IPM21_11155 [Acidobacteria bacterium]|nr:hypothetical protein [Acidobacteriota bacterium]
MPFLTKYVLWIDCLGALATGALLFILSGSIAPLYGLPQSCVVGHGIVHLVYGTYSFSLAVRRTRTILLITLLVFANAAWAFLCIIFAAKMVESDPVFAAVHFLIEGIYVGGLAYFEWNQREALQTA